MYTRWLPFLNNKKIILASGSVARKQILNDLGLKFEIIPSDFPEDLEKTNPIDYVKHTSEKKFEHFLNTNNINLINILITADTIVEHDGTILEKPQNEKDIYEWFNKYSNSEIICYTSVVIGIIENEKVIKSRQFINKTVVYFDELNDEIISDYLKTGEHLGKAGGFSIQGFAKTLIKKIDGCYYNVVGFPVNEFINNLLDLLIETYGENGWQV